MLYSRLTSERSYSFLCIQSVCSVTRVLGLSPSHNQHLPPTSNARPKKERVLAVSSIKACQSFLQNICKNLSPGIKQALKLSLLLNIVIFENETWYSLVNIYRCFEGKFCLHPQNLFLLRPPCVP